MHSWSDPNPVDPDPVGPRVGGKEASRCISRDISSAFVPLTLPDALAISVTREMLTTEINPFCNWSTYNQEYRVFLVNSAVEASPEASRQTLDTLRRCRLDRRAKLRSLSYMDAAWGII